MAWILTGLLGGLAWLTWDESMGSTAVLWPHVGLFFWLVVLGLTLTPGARRRARGFWAGLTGRRLLTIAAALAFAFLAGAAGLLSPAWAAFGCIGVQLWASLEKPHFSLPALALAAGISLGAAEAALVAASHSPRAAQNPVLGPLARKLYNRFAPMFQFLPECSTFDAELLYKIAPGGCVFEGDEFRVRVPGNSLGLPDDEESLEEPEIVFLGDSWTMGWGVEPEETFAARYEAAGGVRTLTAGVASYGTARELLMLRRIDRGRLRRIYVQYHSNDLDENRQFVELGCQLKPHRPVDYDRWIDYYAGYRRYWPGKAGAFLLRGALIRALEPIAGRRPSDDPDAEPRPKAQSEAGVLAATLACFSDTLRDVEVRLFHSSAARSDQSSFAQALAGEVAARDSLADIDFQVVHLEPLPSDHFYPLDVHPNAKGHAAIARQLLDFSQSARRPTPSAVNDKNTPPSSSAAPARRSSATTQRSAP